MQKSVAVAAARQHEQGTHSMGCCMRTARVHVVYVCDMSTLEEPTQTCSCTATAPLHLHATQRVNARTSSPLLSPQRLSVSSSMTPGRRARARREHLDRRLKVPDGEQRSGPAPVISRQLPDCSTTITQGPHIRCLPGRPPSLARALPLISTLSLSVCTALRPESGPPYSLPVKLSDDTFGPGPPLAPPVVIRGNK